MLDWNTVLKYIKGRLALPSGFIEKTEDEIKEWITLFTIPNFSKFFPDVEVTGVDPTQDRYKHEQKDNMYYFYDDEELDILDIQECYFPLDNQMFTGHPQFGTFTFTNMKEWALQVFKSKMIQPFTMISYTYQFFPPNMVRVLPKIDRPFLIQYEREQPHDLRRIPAVWKREFLDLALADVMIQIGTIRSHYGDGRITTPWGEIPLNGDTLKSDGTELKREVEERLQENTIPPVIIDIG